MGPCLPQKPRGCAPPDHRAGCGRQVGVFQEGQAAFGGRTPSREPVLQEARQGLSPPPSGVQPQVCPWHWAASTACSSSSVCCSGRGAAWSSRTPRPQYQGRGQRGLCPPHPYLLGGFWAFVTERTPWWTSLADALAVWQRGSAERGGWRNQPNTQALNPNLGITGGLVDETEPLSWRTQCWQPVQPRAVSAFCPAVEQLHSWAHSW